jgi:predicted DNA-binding transcriptional regulator AlpA
VDETLESWMTVRQMGRFGSDQNYTGAKSPSINAAGLVDESATNTYEHYSARLTTREICAIARYGPITLWRRIKTGQMPRPVDRGREHIFDREAVLKALGLKSSIPDQPSQSIKTNPDAFHKARARQLRHSSPKNGR